VQHLREHGIEPEEAEECFFHEYAYSKDDTRFDDVYILDGERIGVDAYAWCSRIRAAGLRVFSPGGK
jgi:hypothetical protein